MWPTARGNPLGRRLADDGCTGLLRGATLPVAKNPNPNGGREKDRSDKSCILGRLVDPQEQRMRAESLRACPVVCRGRPETVVRRLTGNGDWHWRRAVGVLTYPRLERWVLGNDLGQEILVGEVGVLQKAFPEHPQELDLRVKTVVPNVASERVVKDRGENDDDDTTRQPVRLPPIEARSDAHTKPGSLAICGLTPCRKAAVDGLSGGWLCSTVLSTII